MAERHELADRTPRFELGQCVITPGAMVALAFNDIQPAELLRRHMFGDFGDLDAEDTAANEAAIEDGDRILLSYLLQDGQKVWIITEADRSASTILTPSEY